jgi:thioredoxin 1
MNNNNKITFQNRNDYKAFISENSSKLIIVKAYADWCAPCKRVAPIIETHIAALIQEHGSENIVFIELNIDDDADIATYLNIKKLPTLISYISGELTYVNISADENEISSFFKKNNYTYSIKSNNDAVF